MYNLILVVEIIMVLIFLIFWDLLNALGIFYPGVISLLLKTFFIVSMIPLGIFRFYKLYATSPKYINPNVSWRIKGPLIGLVVLGIYFYNWGVMHFWRGMWIANHNNDIAGFHFSNFGITTAVTRSWYHNTCPNKDEPWHVYTTLPEDALGSIFINFHINPDSCKGDWDPKLEYSEVDTVEEIPGISIWKTWTEQEEGEYRPPSHEYFQRRIYTCLLKNLQESKIYAFKISQEGWKKDPDLYYHRNFNTKKMKIINGGDIGNVKVARQMNENVVKDYDADIILIGGDVAYDNNFSTWFYCYDYILKRLNYLRKNDDVNATRVIPLIMAVGNHDLGVNAYSGRDLLQDEDDSRPVFKHFFPQNTFNDTIPKRIHRRTFFPKRIGSEVLFLVLDTGYEVEMADQVDFIRQELSQDSTYKFGIYHFPMYSAWK